MTRKFIHIDMDAFFASVEILDRPELAGTPLVVGGSPEGRGVVAAASYEARKYGVRSAMPMKRALELCPQLVIVRGRFERYKEISRQVLGIIRRYTDVIEPLSLDECYLDVTENKLGFASATALARDLRETIRRETGLTASAGVAPLKFLAKVASDSCKPDGLRVITPAQVAPLLETLPVRHLWGVGKVTERKLAQLGIKTAGELARVPEDDLRRRFGKFGPYLQAMAKGLDSRDVVTERKRKQIGRETTFAQDLHTAAEMSEALQRIARDVFRSLGSHRKRGRSLTLKLRYGNFETVTRGRTTRIHFRTAEEIYQCGLALLSQALRGTRDAAGAGASPGGAVPELVALPERTPRGVRLLGLSVSDLEEVDSDRGAGTDGPEGAAPPQESLFET